MAQKQLTVIVLRADRELWTGGPLRLQVTDLRAGLHVLKDVTVPGTSHTIQFNLDLPFDAGQAYGIHVDSEGHRAAWQIIRRRTFLREQSGHTIEVDSAFLRLMVIPENPSSTDLNEGYDKLLDEGSPTVIGPQKWSREGYVPMENDAKMAFLNIDAKLRETRINGLPVRSFVKGVGHVAPARVFLFMKPELKELVEASADFSSAPGHEDAPADAPFPLPNHPDSWKHNLFGAGNLQLSFSESTMPLPVDPTQRVYSVDADIDLERGLLHVAEWLANEVFHPGQKTDQTLVYALLFSQGIIPHYTLRPLFG